jgi:sugar fermentation stimulation protein A
MQACCLYVVQRDDCDGFAPCQEKDPAYAQCVIDAAASGVQMIAVMCTLCPDKGEIRLLHELPVHTQWMPVQAS